jgi:hypothetical protein
LLPVLVQGPFISYDKAKEAAHLPDRGLDSSLQANMMVVYQIFAGGNHCFAQAYNVLAKPTRLMSAYSAWRQTNVLGVIQDNGMEVDATRSAERWAFRDTRINFKLINL